MDWIGWILEFFFVFSWFSLARCDEGMGRDNHAKKGMGKSKKWSYGLVMQEWGAYVWNFLGLGFEKALKVPCVLAL